MPALSAIASLSKERTAWNKVMTSTYGVKLKGTNRFKRTTRTKHQRRATRARKFETQTTGHAKRLHDTRLQLLDVNNPGDDPDGSAGNDDEDDEEYQDDGDDYDDGDDEQDDGESRAGSKRKRKQSNSSSSSSSSCSSSSSSTSSSSSRGKSRKTKKSKVTGEAAKALERTKRLPRPCTLEQALLDPEADAIFSSVLTLPNNCPARHFCPVTGLVASYRDPATNVPYATKAAYSMIAERAPRIW